MIVSVKEITERTIEAAKTVSFSEKDSGSVQVQIVSLTGRILSLAQHVIINKKDQSAKRRLTILVGKRKRFLNYLKRTAKDMFEKVSQTIEALKQ